MRQNLKPFIGVILAFTGAIFFSAKAVTVKLAYLYDISAVDLLNLRMVFSLPFYMIMAVYVNKNQEAINVSRKDWINIILLGLLGYYMASFLDFAGLKYISAGMERLILFSYPTIVVLMSAVIYKKRIAGKEIIALLLTYAGISLVFFNNIEIKSSEYLWIGSLLIFGSAITYASYLVGSGRLIPRIGTLRFTSYAMIISSLAVITHYLIAHDFTIITYRWEIYALSIFMAVFSTVLPSFFISESIRLLGSGKAAIIASIGPVSTILLAYIFLGEEIYFIEIAGTLLVLAGVLFVSTGKK